MKFWTRLSVFLCLLGLTLSIYSYYVEYKKEIDSKYEALCDINEKIACSKVFTSKYGKGFGLLHHLVGEDDWLNQPNSVYGVIFYIIYLTLICCQFNLLPVLLGVVANCGSVYLAYILLFVLNDVCVVCFTIYAVNFLLLLSSIVLYQRRKRVRFNRAKRD